MNFFDPLQMLAIYIYLPLSIFDLKTGLLLLLTKTIKTFLLIEVKLK